MKIAFSKFIVMVLLANTILLLNNLHADNIETHMPVKSTGVVRENREVVIAAKIMGRIQSLPYEEGQSIKSGEVLIKLEDAELRAELTAVHALAKLAATELAHLRKQETRLQSLAKNSSVSKDAMDKAIFDATAAKQKLNKALANVEKAKALLSETEIRAPFDSIVIRKFTELGAVTSPGTALMKLQDHKQLKFRTLVKEHELQHIHMGQDAVVNIDALDDLAITGKVSKLIPSGDTKTHVFIVEITLPTQKNLYPGMFGKITF